MGGDAFGFVMKLDGLSFPEAIVKLGERAGIKVSLDREELGPREKERLELRKAMEFAREQYHAFLKDLPEAKIAREYLVKRGVTPETVARFKLGYAPRGGGLVPAATRKGFSVETLVKAGLAVQREDRLRECFWSRLLFPILNARGETVGFGGRVLGDGEPKYLNSSETPLFSKRSVLYGFFEALPEARRARSVILLEGYMDVLALHQFGFNTACAPLGTAVTDEHVTLLKRYANQVTIVFDPDAAGAQASLRGAELLLVKGISVSVATVPEGLDPDELLLKRGPDGLQAVLAEADDLAAFKTRLLIKECRGPLGPQDKARIASQVLETVRKCPDEVLKGEWLRRLAETLGVNEENLRLQLQKGTPAPARIAARSPGTPGRPLPVQDRDILFCLLKAPALASPQGSDGETLVAESDFSDARARGIFQRLREVLSDRSVRADGAGWTGKALAGMAEEAAALLREMLCDEREIPDPAATAAGIVGRLRKQRRLAELEPLIHDEACAPELRREHQQLLTELKGTRKGVSKNG
ncbi:MAG: DNA primase [Elusimicrobia bacterium GWA2_69_24]|nr:MAG: DNA primase [Elusimicrobia bacterium GWA2_69_24]